MKTPERAKSGKKENLVINGDKTAGEWQEMFRERECLKKIIEEQEREIVFLEGLEKTRDEIFASNKKTIDLQREVIDLQKERIALLEGRPAGVSHLRLASSRPFTTGKHEANPANVHLLKKR